jgi:DNA-binding NtrC family response regulator
MVKRGTFRDDLFFWLNVVQLRVPPLRERIEDVAPIAEHLVARIARLYGEKPKPIAGDALAALQAFNWPDNARELANVIEHAVSVSTLDRITAADLPDKVRLARPSASPSLYEPVIPLAMMERNQIAHALRVAEGNQSKAARLLQIQRQRLYRKIEAFGLQYLTRVSERENEANEPESPELDLAAG